MKKQMIVLVALAISSMAMAIDRSAVIKMTLTSPGNEVGDELILIESNSYSDNRDTGADIDKVMSITNPATNEFIYAFGSFSTTGKLSMAALNQLEGMPLGVQCNTADTQYTISFPNVTIASGRDSLYLEDLLQKTLTKIRPNGSYTFTIENAQKGQEINTRFRIHKPYDFQVCAYYDNVVITGNTSTDNVIITNNAGDTIVNVAPTKLEQIIDLSSKPSGHYILTVNGTQYEFCNKPVKDN